MNAITVIAPGIHLFRSLISISQIQKNLQYINLRFKFIVNVQLLAGSGFARGLKRYDLLSPGKYV
jgi:hypothetical protein